MSGTKIAILIFVAAILITGTILFVKKVIPKIKRKKLSEGIADYAKTLGKTVTAEEVKKSLEAADNKEIDVLIEFAGKLKDKDMVGALAMGPKVNPILNKTHLMEVVFA